MPACRDCKWFVDNGDRSICALSYSVAQHLPSVRRRQAAKSCAVAILLKWAPLITGRVLEVGCGVWKLPRWLLGKAGCEWTGLDPRWGRDRKGVVRGRAGDMPFADESFDWVVTVGSIEHWHERGDTVLGGLRECWRVLVPGGRLLVAAPFFWHGEDMFYLGRVSEFLELFRTAGFRGMGYGRWREDHEPLPVEPRWREPNAAPSKESRRALEELERRRRRPISSWVLEVVARK